jgi:hypothetical protein
MTAAAGIGVLAGRFLISSASRPAAAPQTQPAQTSAIGADAGMAGDARHEYGTVGGVAAGGANSGYGATGTREVR